MASSSVATKQRQNRSIFYSCPGAAGPTGPIGPLGDTGTIGQTGPKGDAGSFTGDLTMTKGINLNITESRVNNYILIGGHSFYLITSDYNAPSNITGIATGFPGRSLTLVNTSLDTQTFLQEDALSAESNRFVLGSADKPVGVNRTITFIYVNGLTIGSATNQSRWVMTSNT